MTDLETLSTALYTWLQGELKASLGLAPPRLDVGIAPANPNRATGGPCGNRPDLAQKSKLVSS